MSKHFGEGMEMKKMQLGKEIFKEIPQLEVIATGGEKAHTFYLSPFRAYGFQVSGTDDGQGSFGTSEFIGLQNIYRNNNERIAKAIFRAMAGNALTAHNQYYQKLWEPSFEEGKIFDTFIDSSYDWIKLITDMEDRKVKESRQLDKKGIIETLKNKLSKKQA
jgi:hypothetical protein